MKVIVFGSRTWTDSVAIYKRLGSLPAGTIVVHGASPGGGADLIADRAGRACGLTVIPVPIEDQDRQRAAAMGRPRFAPLARTLRMLNDHPDADLAIGFRDGDTPGSTFTNKELVKRGIPVETHLAERLDPDHPIV